LRFTYPYKWDKQENGVREKKKRGKMVGMKKEEFLSKAMDML